MRWPAGIKAGQESDALLTSLDLFLGFCQLAEIPVPGNWPLDGGTFVPALDSEAEVNNDRKLLWQTGAHAELDRKSWLAYRDGPLKYLNSPVDGEFLFNLANDPHEEKDLKEQSPETFQKMKQAAYQWAEELRRSAKAP